MVKKIISGGQTGADQAALDIAIKLGISHGGWIPKGRLTENGILDPKYQLEEMETTNYNVRTEQNVIDSDGTLIISHGKLSGGSDYTRDMVLRHKDERFIKYSTEYPSACWRVIHFSYRRNLDVR